MKVQHDENATLIHVIYNEPIAWNVSKRREANCIDNLIVPLQSLSYFLEKAVARLSSCTTSVLQATIKGWWWLRATLLCGSG